MYYFLYFILIFSSCFSDLLLGNLFGEFFRAPGGVLAIFVFLILLVRKIKIDKQVKPLFLASLFFFGLIGFDLIINSIMFSPFYMIGDEALIIKELKGLVYFFSIFAYVFDLVYLGKRLSNRKRSFPFVFSFFFNFLVLILELTNKDFINSLHINTEYSRIRLLTPEASTTASLILTECVATFYYYSKIRKSKIGFVTFFICLALFFITTTSKSLFICLALLLLLFVFMARQIKTSIKLVVFGLLMFFCIVFLSSLISLLESDIANYTSVATRLYTSICAFILMFLMPFGCGNGGGVILLKNTMANDLNWYSNMFPNFNLSEIHWIINMYGSSAVTAKSGIGQFVLLYGLIGFIIACYIIHFCYKRVKKNAYATLMLSCFVVLSLFFELYNGYALYSIFSLMLLESLYSQKDFVEKKVKRKFMSSSYMVKGAY